MQSTFTIQAHIINDRWRHDINNDHWGDLSDLAVLIEEPIGPWAAGTPLHYVIADLAARTTILESSNHRTAQFTANAVLVGAGSSWEDGGTTTTLFSANAVFFASFEDAFTIDSQFQKVFTIDAWISGVGEFSVNAVLI